MRQSKTQRFREVIEKALNRPASIGTKLFDHQLVFLDDATGLFNARYLHLLLEKEIRSARKTGQSFAVLFIDIDHFKSINDRFGHCAGTRLLNQLAVRLKESVRENDRVFRYGGDEFITILSPSDLSTAKTVAERIRKATFREQFLGLTDLRVTVSIGIALFPDHAETGEAVVQAADFAMYAAKKAHRNTVSVSKCG